MAEKALFSTLPGKFTRKNFAQGFHSGRRQEVPWDPEPLILVVPLQKLHQSGEIISLLLLHDQLPGITSEVQVLYKVYRLGTN